MSPERYRNLGGESGITSYAIGLDFIAVQWKPPAVYIYDHVRPGRAHVEHMKALAEGGRGLGTYISQHVGKAYSRRQAEW